LTVYRIGSAKYPANDGEGAKLFGGRWNHKGIPMIYRAETASLSALEVLANSANLPAGMALVEIEIPEYLPIVDVQTRELPAGWDYSVPSSASKDIGTEWARHKIAAVMSVPSVIIPRERNYLLNPLHHDFRQIRFGKAEPFVFDPRLRQPRL
jgi:RES domain-containing protein